MRRRAADEAARAIAALFAAQAPLRQALGARLLRTLGV